MQHTTLLTEAIQAVTRAVRAVDRARTKGVRWEVLSAEAVELAVQGPMLDAGLSLLPIRYDARWDGERCDVVVTYCLMHTSGESIEVQSVGTGTGADGSTRAAATWARKTAIITTFGLAATAEGQSQARPESADVIAACEAYGIPWASLLAWLSEREQPPPWELPADRRARLVRALASEATRRQIHTAGGTSAPSSTAALAAALEE